MLKNGLLTDDPATSELSTDMDTDENQTELNENILKAKKSKTLQSVKSSKSEDSYFPKLAKFICENLEISEFENDKAMDPRTTFHSNHSSHRVVWFLDPKKVKSMDKIYSKVLENDFDVSYDKRKSRAKFTFKCRWCDT